MEVVFPHKNVFSSNGTLKKQVYEDAEKYPGTHFKMAVNAESFILKLHFSHIESHQCITFMY